MAVASVPRPPVPNESAQLSRPSVSWYKKTRVKERQPQKSKINWNNDAESVYLSKKEEMARKRQHADSILMVFQAQLDQKRDKRFCRLKQRVHLQHRLISKNDEYANLVRKLEEEEQAKKLEDQWKAKKELFKKLQNHYLKQGNVKKQDIPSLCPKEESKVNSLPGTPDQDKEIEEIEQVAGRTDLHTTKQDVSSMRSSCVEPSSAIQKLEHPENAILKLLGIEHSPGSAQIDKMWVGLKAHTDEQLRPITHYCNDLKGVSSPSVRECLDYYDKPIPIDYYTSKPIPLTSVLYKMRNPPASSKLFTLKMSKSAADLRSKFGQRCVKRLENEECVADWFAIGEKQPRAQTPSTSPSISTCSTNSTPQEVKATTGDNQMGFLTESGTVVNLSSTKKQAQTKRETRTPSLSSSSSVLVSSRWQPLSASAAIEGTRSKEYIATSRSYRHKITWKPYFTEIG